LVFRLRRRLPQVTDRAVQTFEDLTWQTIDAVDDRRGAPVRGARGVFSSSVKVIVRSARISSISVASYISPGLSAATQG
jgi:hypothetical protein